MQDAYKSISESILHAGTLQNCKVDVKWIHAEEINKNNVSEKLSGLKGVLVAPGFGDRGMEGKIETIKFVRENNIPFFGICLGMQSAVIEFAKNVLGYSDANSTEMDKKHIYSCYRFNGRTEKYYKKRWNNEIRFLFMFFI